MDVAFTKGSVMKELTQEELDLLYLRRPQLSEEDISDVDRSWAILVDASLKDE